MIKFKIGKYERETALGFLAAVVFMFFLFFMVILFLFGLGYGIGALIVLIVGHPIAFDGVSLQIIIGTLFVVINFLK